MTHPFLQTFITRTYTPLRLPPDLVVGTIRWQRALGLPEGRLADAFVLKCWHVDVFTDYDEPSRERRITMQHPIDVTDGPHDEHYYRLTYSTVARQSHGSREPNHFQAQLVPGVHWPRLHLGRHGHRTLAPTGIDFDYTGEAQQLPDIDVYDAFELIARESAYADLLEVQP